MILAVLTALAAYGQSCSVDYTLQCNSWVSGTTGSFDDTTWYDSCSTGDYWPGSEITFALTPVSGDHVTLYGGDPYAYYDYDDPDLIVQKGDCGAAGTCQDLPVSY